MGWSGNEKVGEGKMTIVESHPNHDIKIKVDFTKPFEGSIGSDFAFKPDGDKTAVNWAMMITGATGERQIMTSFIPNDRLAAVAARDVA